MRMGIVSELAQSAAHLWNSPYALPETKESYFSEPQDKINKCLSCTHSECFNCLSGRKQPKQGRPKKATSDLFAFLVAIQLPISEICEVLSISRRTYFRKEQQLLSSIEQHA